MKKKLLSCLGIILFLAGFIFSHITGTTIVKDTFASTSMSLPAVLYSVSNTAAVLLTLVVIFALIALISYWGRQNNVGFLFLALSVVLFIICLIILCCDTDNYVIYNDLVAALKENGIKSVKKRDVHITITPDVFCYITSALGILAVAIGFPKLSNHNLRQELKREIEPYIFIGPHLILFLLFFLVPVIYGVYAAFTKWDIFGTPKFVGLANFKTILFDAENVYYHQFRNGLWNTVKFVICSVPGCIILPLGLALALRPRLKGSKVLQGIFYLPALMSASSVMLAWEFFFKKTYGMLNNLFGSTANWFEPPYSWIMVVVISVWWCNGSNMVIFQSALAGIPQDHYEAASIDGANTWQKFWNITLPGIRYPLAYTLTHSIVAQFNVYAQVDILLGYDNGEANAVLMMYIRDTAFKQQVAGIASAMALVLGVCIALCTLMQVRVMREQN